MTDDALDLPTLFAQAEELDGDARERFLVDLGQRAPALERELRTLLAAAEPRTPWLDSPGWRAVVAAGQESLPAAIGPYRVLAEVGRGGAGRVFLAEESGDGFVRRVAVKVLAGALPAPDAVERFRTEGRLLAGLEHPGIARLYDAGKSDDGVLFLAMEFIDGTDIVRFVQERKLATRQRVELFLQVLEAVQFAHRHLIVHRDLKPANLLVDTAGRAKLLDFGIARLIEDAEAGGDAAWTRTGQRWLTPAYSSPEQIRGERTTTAADIYSLGVVLYELLTGRRPRGEAGAELEAAVRGTEPLPPSRGGGSADDGSAVPAEELRGDLDAITLYALRQEAESRYRSVEAFAEDLRRYLDGFPVLARQDTRRYRWSKFVERNRGALAAGLGIFLALAAGLGLALWQARKAATAQAVAESRFADLRGLASALLFDITAAIEPLDGSAPAMQLTFEKALQYLDRLDAAGGHDLQEELAAGYGRLGEIAARLPVFGRGSGDWEKGAAAFERSLALRRQRVARPGAEPDERVRLGRTLTSFCGALRTRRDPDRAKTICRDAVREFEALVADYPDRRDYQFDLATAMSQQLLAMGAHQGKEAVLASPELQKTGALWLEIGGDPPATVAARQNLAWGLASISEWLRLAERLEDAVKLSEWALRATHEVVDQPGYSAARQRQDRAQALEAAAFAHWDLGRLGEALDEFDEAYEVLVSLRRNDQQMQQAILLFNLTGSMARLAGEAGDVERGEKALAKADRLIAEAKKLWQPDTVIWTRGLVERDRGHMYRAAFERPGTSAGARATLGEQGRRAYDRAIAIFETLVHDGEDPFGVGPSLRECRDQKASFGAPLEPATPRPR